MRAARSLPSRLARLPERYRWALHNLVAHPVGELLYQVGQTFPRLEAVLERVEGRLHDGTVPVHKAGTGRG